MSLYSRQREENIQRLNDLLEQRRNSDYPTSIVIDIIAITRKYPNDFQKLDLPGANLEGANLEGANLEQVKLRDADLRGANLKYAYLPGADLEGANLEGANLERANLYGANLRGTFLQRANLQETKLDMAHLEMTNLQEANLQEAILERAYLQRADLERANLEGANLEGANLGEANLEGANLEGANLRDAILRYAFLRDADLQRANLQRANLQRANLQRANLQRANLQSADLRHANLEEAQLQQAVAIGADFEGANLNNAYLHYTDLTNADLEGVNLQRTRYENVIGIDHIIAEYMVEDNDTDNEDYIPLDQNEGVAFEIHNAFYKFKLIKNQYITLINQPDKQYENIYSYIQEIFPYHINVLFPNDSEKINQFNTAFDKINNRIDRKDKDLIGKSIDFVFAQDDNFKTQYLISFLNDSCNAYSGAVDNTSCVKGIIERLVLSVKSAIEVLCAGDETCSGNETYSKLNVLFKFDIDEEASKWFDKADKDTEMTTDKDGRRTNFMNYLRDKARELNIYSEQFENYLIEYTDKIDYSFENLTLGGRKSKKTRKSKKSRKSRKSKKSRKARKSIKAKKSKKSKKSRKSRK